MMKQTVEEAARTHWSESTYNKDAELAYDERDSIAIKALAKAIALRAFKKGAEWRINSLWHKTKDEVPQAHGEYENEHYPQIPCLVYGKLSTGTGYGVRYWNITEQCWDDEECDDYECSKDAIEEWAYLDDLIPNKKQ